MSTETDHCPRCQSDDLCIDNIDGYTCESCGLWFDIDDDGNTLWTYDHKPMELML